MALRQTYLALKAKLPKDAKTVLVMRGRGNDELAPSKKLLDDFNLLKKQFTKGLDGYQDPYRYAWDKSQYEERFRKEMLNNPTAMNRLATLAEESRNKDIFLICYEGEDKPCHRTLLLRIAKEYFNADIDFAPYSPKKSFQPTLFDSE